MSKTEVKIGLNFIQDAPLTEAIKWWKATEEAGFHWIGIPDSPALIRELYVCETACALNTKTIPFAPNVSNPISRHPSVTASALFSLDELAPGRISLGIGTGDSAIYGVGLKGSSVAALKEYVVAVKGLLRGEKVTWGGKSFQPEWRHWSPPKNIPIYIACSGPKILKMASQEADGLILNMGFAKENIDYTNEIITSACSEVNRDPKDLDIWWSTGVNFASSAEDARNESLGVPSHWLARFTLEGKQIPDEHKAAIKKIAAEWSLSSHGRKFTNLVDMAKELGVYEWMISRSAQLFGTPEDIAKRLNYFSDLGVNQWTFVVLGGDHDRMDYIKKMKSVLHSLN